MNKRKGKPRFDLYRTFLDGKLHSTCDTRAPRAYILGTIYLRLVFQRKWDRLFYGYDEDGYWEQLDPEDPRVKNIPLEIRVTDKEHAESRADPYVREPSAPKQTCSQTPRVFIL